MPALPKYSLGKKKKTLIQLHLLVICRQGEATKARSRFELNIPPRVSTILIRLRCGKAIREDGRRKNKKHHQRSRRSACPAATNSPPTRAPAEPTIPANFRSPIYCLDSINFLNSKSAPTDCVRIGYTLLLYWHPNTCGHFVQNTFYVDVPQVRLHRLCFAAPKPTSLTLRAPNKFNSVVVYFIQRQNY